MLNICTVNAGNYQGHGVHYTNVLFDSIRRNLAEGTRGRFVVLSDTTEGYDEGITVLPLYSGLHGWFNKLALFRPGLFEPGDRALYFDLSCVICGRLDELASYEGPFAILRDFYRPDGLQSSVMAWTVAIQTECVWVEWACEHFPQPHGGDQSWIERCVEVGLLTPELLQEIFPDRFISYKVSGEQAPLKASVCVFHGRPKPHEVTTGWVPQVWKKDGLTRAELDNVCNTAIETYMSQVRINCARDLPWLDYAPAHDRQVAIVGGSPSVAKAVHELQQRQEQGQEIWALNGSFAWMQSRGIQPTGHVMIDAQVHNAQFLYPGYRAQYYLASQCHPSIFDQLPAGYPVTMLHCLTTGMQDYLEALQSPKPTHLIGGGTTVGMKALLVAHMLGYRTIHLYGMDSSYADDAHHAYPQPQNDGERIEQAVYKDRVFRCAPWMVTQATDFIGLAAQLIKDGTIITVNGDGLIPYIAREWSATPTIIPAEIRAAEVLKRLGHDLAVGVEVGVFGGDMSAALLAREDLHLLMVDSWNGDGASYQGDSGDFHMTLSQEQQDRYYERTKEMVRFAGSRAHIFRMDSIMAAAKLPDHSLDFVFIDADHSYEGSKADVEAWAPKVKPGGLLCGHDYGNTQFPKFGVTRSVNEFAEAHGFHVELGENFTWFIRMPVLSRKEALCPV